MQIQARRFCQLAAAMLAIATVIGALGAHALRPRMTADHYDVLQTALHYQYFHSLGLLGVGLLFDRVPVYVLRIAAWLLFAGTLLFSGSLYLILAGAPRVVGVLTPIGGVALIVAWCLIVFAMGQSRTAVH